MSIAINPFSLQTVHTILEDATMPVLEKGFRAVGAAAYDIYVKNPWDITVGNLQAISGKPLPEQVARGAIATLGAMYTLTLYGGTGYLLGLGVQSIGSAISSPMLITLAEKIQAVSEGVFLTGSVPIYALIYALPKKIVESLPAVFTALQKAVCDVARAVFRYVIAPLWNSVIVPLARNIVEVLRVVCESIGNAIAFLAARCMDLGRLIFEYALVPFYRYVMLPIGRAVEAALNAVAPVAHWIFQNLVAPLGRAMYEGSLFTLRQICRLGELLRNGITFAATCLRDAAVLVCRVVGTIFEYTAAPLWTRVIMPLAKATASVASAIGSRIAAVAMVVIRTIGSGIAQVAQHVANAASVAYKYTLVPFWNYVLVPSAEGIAWVFTHAVVPLAQTVGSLAYSAAMVVGSVVSAVFQAIGSGVAALHRAVILPAIHSMQVAATAVVNHAQSIFSRISGIWQRVLP